MASQQCCHQVILYHPCKVGYLYTGEYSFYTYNKYTGMQSSFKPGKQHDSHEFLVFLMDLLMEHMTPE